MFDVVMPIAVLAILLQFVAQVRRLIAHAILNGTIRKAMEVDPASAPLLIAKLEPRPRWPDGLTGWIMLAGGIALAAAGLFSGAAERQEALQVAALSVTIGAAILVYAWWVARATPPGP